MIILIAIIILVYIVFFYKQSIPPRKVFKCPTKVKIVPNDSIIRRLLDNAKLKPNAPAYSVRKNYTTGDWQTSTWAQYAKNVKDIGKSILKSVGPEQTIAILCSNRPEWPILALGSHCAAGRFTGIYSSCSSEQVAYITNKANASILVIENQTHFNLIKPMLNEMKTLKLLIFIEKIDISETKANCEMISIDEFLEQGKNVSDGEVMNNIKKIDAEDIACYIFTSGTTGPPKCVMLSHKNANHTSSTLSLLTVEQPEMLHYDNHVIMSYLPLAHVAEQLITMYVGVTIAAQVYFIANPKALLEELKSVRPTLFMGVPRVWEKIYAGITSKLKVASFIKKNIFSWSSGILLNARTIQSLNGQWNSITKFKVSLARKVTDAARKKIGLDRCGLYCSGAAPLSKDIADFFFGLDMPIHEVYGQSECTGVCSLTNFGNIKNGTVGFPNPGIDIQIANDGEILVKGPNVFTGYFNDKELTAKTFSKDGYLKTGDIGIIDKDGFLKITGRIKDIIITSGGKNVTPSFIELKVKKEENIIGEVLLIGDGRKFITALISLDAEEVTKYAKENGIEEKNVYSDSRVKALVAGAIDRSKSSLNHVEQIKKFRILPRPLSLEKNEVTPTLKVKRKNVVANFASLIEEMYA